MALWVTSSFIKTSSSQEEVPPLPELSQDTQPLLPPPQIENIPDVNPLDSYDNNSPSASATNEEPPPPPTDPVVETEPSASEPEPISEESAPPVPTNVQIEKKEIISDDIETLMAPYNYDTGNRRDPFREFRIDVGSEITEDGVFVGPLRPLQRFDLDKIIPVAIIWDVESPKAMFVDPTSKVHILGKDERIGRNNGYIATIREGEIVVIETVKRRGQLSFKTSILKIGSSN
ncbi:MAG: pilus assembly protein PilP [Bdellovibrionaceae bacterium]|nr:pilus assembly protein PilP [Pseudobdellovibrionaceae bacterium]